jgi:hypothetical protein
MRHESTFLEHGPRPVGGILCDTERSKSLSGNHLLRMVKEAS